MEAGIAPADYRPWPSVPASAKSGPLPQPHPPSVANLSSEAQAFNHTDPRSIQDPTPDPPTPVGSGGGLITKVPTDEAYDPALDTLDLIGPPLDMTSNAATPGEGPMVPDGSYVDNELAGSTGNSSSYWEGHLAGSVGNSSSFLGDHVGGSIGNSSSYLDGELGGSIGNSSVGPGGLPLEPQTAASDHWAGTGARRSATLAPVRLFSKAAIYPYASQGLSCQGADSTVLSTAAYGGTTYCLDIRGGSKTDAADVRALCNPASLVMKQSIPVLSQLWPLNHEIMSAEV
jgi:hypothetical protein